MVVLERLLLPSMKIIITILAGILILLLAFGGYVYKVRSDAEGAKLRQERQLKQEQQNRQSYEQKEKNLIHSPNLMSLRTLYSGIFDDRISMMSAGWIQDEVYCEINNCNIRYIRNKERLFNYIVLKKGESEYLPIYTDDELTYDSVIYPINLDANVIFKDRLNQLASCNDVIANTYRFKTLVTGQDATKIEIESPSNYFSLSGNFDWAKFKDVKYGIVNFDTENAFMFELFINNYKNDLITLQTLILKKSALSISVNYFCI